MIPKTLNLTLLIKLLTSHMATEDKRKNSTREEVKTLAITSVVMFLSGIGLLTASVLTETFLGNVVNLMSGSLLIFCALYAFKKARLMKKHH